ncbi:MAG: GNAT family N-acetyltransferase [Eubacteriaceae bacterium]|nr:GNAT family N-acetyltransferase [Eubacteriaceae bacterium]
MGTKSSQNIEIRSATRDDSALILSFVKGLAHHVHLQQYVVSTEDMIEDCIFNKKAAEVIFASLDGVDAGFAVFYQTFSTFLGKAGLYLEDLYVLPDYRGKGIGTELLRSLAQISVERGYCRIEWCVLDWNSGSIEFYKSLGAEAVDGCTIYQMSGEAIDSLAKEY